MVARGKVFEQIKNGVTQIRDFDLKKLGIKQPALSRLLHRLEDEKYFRIEKGALKDIDYEKIVIPPSVSNQNILIAQIWSDLGFIKTNGPCREILKGLLVFEKPKYEVLGISKTQVENCIKRLEENRIILNDYPTTFGLVALGQDVELSSIVVHCLVKIAKKKFVKDRQFALIRRLTKGGFPDKKVQEVFIKALNRGPENITKALGSSSWIEIKKSDEVFQQVERIINNEIIVEAVGGEVFKSVFPTFIKSIKF